MARGAGRKPAELTRVAGKRTQRAVVTANARSTGRQQTSMPEASPAARANRHREGTWAAGATTIEVRQAAAAGPCCQRLWLAVTQRVRPDRGGYHGRPGPRGPIPSPRQDGRAATRPSARRSWRPIAWRSCRRVRVSAPLPRRIRSGRRKPPAEVRTGSPRSRGRLGIARRLARWQTRCHRATLRRARRRRPAYDSGRGWKPSPRNQGDGPGTSPGPCRQSQSPRPLAR